MRNDSNPRSRSRESAAAIRGYIEQRIRNGEWPPGVQLPTERELSSQFGAARNTVRRALGELEEDGQILRHVGRGTFVADAGSGDLLVEPDSREINPQEIMEVRLLLEPSLAGLVVARASQAELEEMRDFVVRSRSCRNMAEFEHWDAKLHRALALASKNQYLIRILNGVHAVRRLTAWGQLKRRGLTEERRKAYQKEHEAIVSALLDRDAERAEAAIRDHLRHVRHNLIGF